VHLVSIRIAAAGDIHIRDANRDQLKEVFARLKGEVELVLLAGDLTTHGEPEQGAWLADACAGLDMPVIAVLGNVGLKGFVGGFPGSSLPDFGEPLLREVYRQTSDDVAALDEGLREIAHCPYRIVLLHYSPCAETLRGEPEGIWAFLGNERIAAPIREHEPDLVLHGHAHVGTFEAKIGASPVYNVSVPVMGRDFWVLELASLRRPTTPIH